MGTDIAIDDDPMTGTNIEIADARGTFEVQPTEVDQRRLIFVPVVD